MQVLVLNAGSSSVKFKLFAIEPGTGRARVLAGGAEPAAGGSHAAAVGRVLEAAGPLGRAGRSIDAVGHRIVHGGERLVEPTLLDDEVLKELASLAELAPLHNRPGVEAVRACREALGRGIPMVAVFDTAFHADLPDVARCYALPRGLADRHHVRRYGFHGTSYRYVSGRHAELTGTAPAATRLIVLHLGSGCSAAAIRGGRSVDTSMGFTPLEGLVMATRAGDLDPSLVAYLAEREGVPAAEVDRWLNERSGLLGLSGRSADLRELLDHEGEDPRARLAVDLFCYRARKYVGAYLAVLGGADALIFTGGIGEHLPAVRGRIVEGMTWCGLAVDPERNRAAAGREGRISPPGAAVESWVIPTDEELVIARDTAARLAGGPAAEARG